jgi:hypothetical protein
MEQRHKAVLNAIPSYGRFLTLREIDQLSEHASSFKDVAHRLIGKTHGGEDITMLEIGSGPRTCLMIGVPHSDEPLGSLVTTFFSHWLANHPEEKNFGWRWLMIPVLERTGMRLNEGWFNTFENYTSMAKTYFREPTEDQYEWTFPIDFQDHTWDTPAPETEVIMKVLKKERPEMLYGLHNTSFYDAYYYLSEDLPEVYPELRKLSTRLRIPLSDSVPDVPFGKVYAHGFFGMYGLKDYVEYYRDNYPEVLQFLRRGACSDEWYKDNIGGFSFNCEVPMYRSPKMLDTRPSSLKLKTVYRNEFKRHKAAIEYVSKIMKELEPYSDLAEPNLYRAASKHITVAQEMMFMKERLSQEGEDSIATNAEVFEHGPLSDVGDLFYAGQVWRVAESVCLAGGPTKICRLMDGMETWLQTMGKSVKDNGGFYQIPIKSAVKLQLGSLLIISDAIGKKKRK